MEQSSASSLTELDVEGVEDPQEMAAASLFEVLASRNRYLEEKELWALCRECCLTLEYVHDTHSLFQSLSISPDSVAFDPDGNVCFLDLDIEPETRYLAPEHPQCDQKSYKSHLFSLGMTLLYATENNTGSNDLQAQISDTFTELLATLTCEEVEGRPDLEIVIDACDKALAGESSQEICTKIVEIPDSESPQSQATETGSRFQEMSDDLCAYLESQSELVQTTISDPGCSTSADRAEHNETDDSDVHEKRPNLQISNNTHNNFRENCLEKTIRNHDCKTNKNGTLIVQCKGFDEEETELEDHHSDVVAIRQSEQKAILLADLLYVLDRCLEEYELWSICRECVLSLQRKRKHLPAYISLDTITIRNSGTISFKAIPEDKPLEVIYMAPELQQKGILNDKTCLYSLGITLRKAAEFKSTSPQSVPGGEALEILITSFINGNPDKRPDLETAYEMCGEYEKVSKTHSQQVCLQLYEEVINAQGSSKDVDSEYVAQASLDSSMPGNVAIAENYSNKVSSDKTLKNMQALTMGLQIPYKSLNPNVPEAAESQSLSAFKNVAAKPRQIKDMKRLPSAFSSPATHFTPIVIQNVETESTILDQHHFSADKAHKDSYGGVKNVHHNSLEHTINKPLSKDLAESEKSDKESANRNHTSDKKAVINTADIGQTLHQLQSQGHLPNTDVLASALAHYLTGCLADSASKPSFIAAGSHKEHFNSISTTSIDTSATNNCIQNVAAVPQYFRHPQPLSQMVNMPHPTVNHNVHITQQNSMLSQASAASETPQAPQLHSGHFSETQEHFHRDQNSNTVNQNLPSKRHVTGVPLSQESGTFSFPLSTSGPVNNGRHYSIPFSGLSPTNLPVQYTLVQDSATGLMQMLPVPYVPISQAQPPQSIPVMQNNYLPNMDINILPNKLYKGEKGEIKWSHGFSQEQKNSNRSPHKISSWHQTYSNHNRYPRDGQARLVQKQSNDYQQRFNFRTRTNLIQNDENGTSFQSSNSPSKDSGISLSQQPESFPYSMEILMNRQQSSANTDRYRTFSNVVDIIQETFGEDEILDSGSDDLAIAEYVMSLSSLTWDTFCSAVTEKYHHLVWNYEVLSALFQTIEGHGPLKLNSYMEELPSAKFSRPQYRASGKECMEHLQSEPDNDNLNKQRNYHSVNQQQYMRPDRQKLYNHQHEKRDRRLLSNQHQQDSNERQQFFNGYHQERYQMQQLSNQYKLDNQERQQFSNQCKLESQERNQNWNTSEHDCQERQQFSNQHKPDSQKRQQFSTQYKPDNQERQQFSSQYKPDNQERQQFSSQYKPDSQKRQQFSSQYKPDNQERQQFSNQHKLGSQKRQQFSNQQKLENQERYQLSNKNEHDSQESQKFSNQHELDSEERQKFSNQHELDSEERQQFSNQHKPENQEQHQLSNKHEHDPQERQFFNQSKVKSQEKQQFSNQHKLDILERQLPNQTQLTQAATVNAISESHSRKSPHFLYDFNRPKSEIIRQKYVWNETSDSTDSEEKYKKQQFKKRFKLDNTKRSSSMHNLHFSGPPSIAINCGSTEGNHGYRANSAGTMSHKNQNLSKDYCRTKFSNSEATNKPEPSQMCQDYISSDGKMKPSSLQTDSTSGNSSKSNQQRSVTHPSYAHQASQFSDKHDSYSSRRVSVISHSSSSTSDGSQKHKQHNLPTYICPETETASRQPRYSQETSNPNRVPVNIPPLPTPYTHTIPNPQTHVQANRDYTDPSHSKPSVLQHNTANSSQKQHSGHGHTNANFQMNHARPSNELGSSEEKVASTSAGFHGVFVRAQRNSLPLDNNRYNGHRNAPTILAVPNVGICPARSDNFDLDNNVPAEMRKLAAEKPELYNDRISSGISTPQDKGKQITNLTNTGDSLNAHSRKTEMSAYKSKHHCNIQHNSHDFSVIRNKHDTSCSSSTGPKASIDGISKSIVTPIEFKSSPQDSTQGLDDIRASHNNGRSFSAVYSRQSNQQQTGVVVLGSTETNNIPDTRYRKASDGSDQIPEINSVLLPYIKKSSIVYHSAVIQLSLTAEVDAFIHSIDEENRQAIEKLLASISQEIAVQRRQRQKTQRLYKKLNEQNATDKKGDQSVSEQTLKDMSDMTKKLSFLYLCQTHLQMLLAELHGLDSSLLCTLSITEGNAQLNLQPASNPYLQFRSISTPGAEQMAVLQAGTPRGVMSYLYTSSALSNGYIHQFLFCFRYILTADQLFTFILEKYYSAQRNNQKDVNMGCIQRRSIDLLQFWIEGYYSVDFAPNKGLLKKFSDFLTEQTKANAEGADNLYSLYAACRLGENTELMQMTEMDEDNIDEGTYFFYLDNSKRWDSFRSLLKRSKSDKSNKGSRGGSWKSKSNFKTASTGSEKPSIQFTVAECSVHVLAEQLTLMEQEQFKKCHPVHFLNSQFQGVGVALSMPGLRTPSMSRKSEANQSPKRSLFVGEPPSESYVVHMINHAQELAHWVSAEILSCGSNKTQIGIITKFLTVAHLCHHVRNYATALSILDGLENIVVRQLPVWKNIPAKVLTYIDELTSVKMKLKSDAMWLMSEKDCHIYPTIPCALFVALHIQQVEIGSFTLASGMYKWDKMRSISEIVDQLRIFRDHNYAFQHDYEIQRSLRRCLSEYSEQDLHAVASTQNNNFHRHLSSTSLTGTLKKVKNILKKKS